jgi:hypothetical protein
MDKTEWFCEDEPVCLYTKVDNDDDDDGDVDDDDDYYNNNNNNNNNNTVEWHQCMTLI